MSSQDKEDLDTETQWRCREQAMCSGGRDESDAVLSQKMPNINGSHQKLEEERKDPPLEPSERAHVC